MVVQEMCINNSRLENVLELKPMIVEDHRGRTIKDYSKELFEKKGIDFVPVETLILEGKRGTLRGIHFQRIREIPKLIHCLTGMLWVVVVDLRKESITLGQHLEMIIDEKTSLYIPKGYGLGTFCLDDTQLICQCGDVFVKEYDDGIKWDDVELGIKWPVDTVDDVLISEKDCNLHSYREYLEKE